MPKEVEKKRYLNLKLKNMSPMSAEVLLLEII